MKFAFVSYHPPLADGSAAGRQLFALGEALRAEGHEVTCWCWRAQEPTGLPDWAEWQPVPNAAGWRVRGRAVLQPRSDIVRADWEVPEGAVGIADDPASFAAVAGATLSIATVHYAVRLDRAALTDWSGPHVQDWRGERTAVRRAGQVWTFSPRVRQAVGRGVIVPATVPMPDQPVPLVDEPVVGLLADWSWPPNLHAADTLVRGWARVRAHVPGARLLLAGRGSCPVGSLPGVEWLGEVPETSDLLSQISVFAFPCPDTSGPKMKTLDALAHGIPVVTTPAGAEGLVGGSGAVLGSTASLASALIDLLRDPRRRARLAVQGRTAVERGHAPLVAARARVRAVASATAG
ncbi:MAG: glycosyl transferase group 1 [Frankiales bacterium]|nr:glycosyl transferase group 1 [Frankiales bacterium]